MNFPQSDSLILNPPPPMERQKNKNKQKKKRKKKIKLEQALNFVDYVKAVSYLTLPSFWKFLKCYSREFLCQVPGDALEFSVVIFSDFLSISVLKHTFYAANMSKYICYPLIF